MTSGSRATGGTDPGSAPITMLHDRVLVEVDQEAGERRSSGGIVIPATAAMGAPRLSWAQVSAVGPHARSIEVGDRVLFTRQVVCQEDRNCELRELRRLE